MLTFVTECIEDVPCRAKCRDRFLATAIYESNVCELHGVERNLATCVRCISVVIGTCHMSNLCQLGTYSEM